MEIKLPEIGKKYPHFDDGKIVPSRHLVCIVKRIITYKEASEIIIKDAIHDFGDKNEFYDDKLLNIWEREKDCRPWLFAEKSEYFIEAEIEGEVANPNWYAMTSNGRWFSMCTLNWLQGGELDWDLEACKYWKTSFPKEYDELFDKYEYHCSTITEKLLENNNFKKSQEFEGEWDYDTQDYHIIIKNGYTNMVGRDWYVHVDNCDFESIGSADIQTTCDFNKLMDCLDIDLRL